MRGPAIVLAATLAASASSAAPTPGQAQADSFARLYVDAVNSDAGFERFMLHDAEPVPREALQGFFNDQRWISGGGVDLIGARTRPGDPRLVEIAVRNRVYGGVQGVEVRLDAADTPRIAAFEPTPAPAWSVPRAKPQSQAEFTARASGLIDKGCAAGLFSGAVLIAAGEKVLVEKACGEASRRYHVANTTSTRFNIGSMDKMFTVVAAMQLVEAGKLSLDATLDRYLDASWLAPEIARQVTVWQLMTHTSGLVPDVADELEAKPRFRLRELDQFKPLVRDSQLATTPGETFNYSNTGMLLLGAVIAQASGEDYYAYVQRHIFAPAGMTATASDLIDDPVENLAIGYTRAPASAYGWRENSIRILRRGIPAGGGFSTVGDLHRFALALQSNKLISQASLQRLWADEDRDNYAAGFEIGHGAVGAAAGHSGLDAGVSTRMRLYLDRGYVAVLLANIDRAAPPLLDAIEGEMVRAPTAAR